jgi:hypothetical protein
MSDNQFSIFEKTSSEHLRTIIQILDSLKNDAQIMNEKITVGERQYQGTKKFMILFLSNEYTATDFNFKKLTQEGIDLIILGIDLKKTQVEEIKLLYKPEEAEKGKPAPK